MLQAADAIERGLRVTHEVPAKDLQARFGYVRSPEAVNDALLKK